MEKNVGFDSILRDNGKTDFIRFLVFHSLMNRYYFMELL